MVATGSLSTLGKNLICINVQRQISMYSVNDFVLSLHCVSNKAVNAVFVESTNRRLMREQSHLIHLPSCRQSHTTR